MFIGIIALLTFLLAAACRAWQVAVYNERQSSEYLDRLLKTPEFLEAFAKRRARTIMAMKMKNLNDRISDTMNAPPSISRA
jgi:hypothetical protein